MMKTTHRIISLTLVTAILVSPALARGQSQQQTPKHQAASPRTAPGTARILRATDPAAHDTTTPGRIARFTTTKSLTDSNIIEDSSGRIGIGTPGPTSPLTVNGIIETSSGQGGIKFPDGSLQTTAGLGTISRDDTLKGDGTQASPLGLPVPLTLTGETPILTSVLVVSNTGTFSEGITANGGPKGAGLRAQGGSSNTIGGSGVIATGGSSLASTVTAGRGVIASGGDSSNGQGGTGVEAHGGQGPLGAGGTAIVAVGGFSSVNGGNAIEAIAGGGGPGVPRGLAGSFDGNVEVTGMLSKAGGSFKIDHPLDPENKYLSHSFVESPDMKNIYDGLAQLDNNGEAVVEMPDWFAALNGDFRYLLTAVGAPMPGLYIAEEIANNRFKISGGMARMRVSWQVTGIRRDAWANQNRIRVEEAKSEKERGHYLHPEAFGQPQERGVRWANQPELMNRIKQHPLGSAREPRPLN